MALRRTKPFLISAAPIDYEFGKQWMREMTAKAREFIDFWIENSVHAVEQFRTRGASQDVSDLTARLIENAEAQGISEPT